MKPQYLLAVAALGLSTSGYTQTDRDLDSHEHGTATLNVAFDNGLVLIELESPWNNLVGFEHAPKTDEQETAVANALSMLQQPDQLFSFNGGDCTIQDVDVDSSLASADGADDHHHDDEKHDDEHHDDEKHDDEHHDDEKHDDEHHEDEHHDDHADESGTHSSVFASYSYQCDSMNKIVEIDTNVFSVWSGMSELNVQMIGPAGQALLMLTPQNNQISTDQVL